MKPEKSVKFAGFKAQAESLELSFGLRVATFSLHASGGSVVQKPFSVTVPDGAEIEAVVTQEDLLRFVQTKTPDNVRIEALHLNPKGIVVVAAVKMLLEIKGNALCQLQILDGKQLHVVLEEVDIMGVGAKGLVQNQLDQLNPVFDAAELPLPVTLTSVELGTGILTLRGVAQPPQ